MKKLIFIFWLTTLSAIGLLAQVDATQLLPLDPAVKIGKLDNGMTFYIRKNSMPQNRLEMRLVVNAGSILEDEEQQGLAHFTEHMAFNGTAHFSKSALVDFLEKSGVRFGADLNAYTSFDETVYMLQLPTDRPGLVDSAFMVMEDWAHQVSMEGEEIDKERGVIREEWRLGLGADDRMRKQYFPQIFSGSKYANRLPIGQIGVIDTASHETLRRFYRDWYRPNLQAIIVTGDLDPELMEAKVIQHFAHITNPENAKERTTFGVPGNVDPIVAIASDPEATGTSVMILYKHPKKELVTVGDFKLKLMQSIYSSMMISRLNEINQKPGSPFISAYSYYGGYMGRASDAYIANASVKENQIPGAVKTLIMENERVKQHGFTQTELERQKKQMLSNLEKRQKEKDKTPSSSFVRDYTSHFLSNAPIPGIDNELELTKNLLPEITLSEINQLASQWVTKENMVVVVTAPKKEGIMIPEKNEVLEMIADAKNEKVDPWIDSFSDAPLLAKNLKNASIKDRVKNESIGIETLTLSNGIKVIIKPTDFKNDEILFSAYGPGGSSLVDDDKVYAANNATRLVTKSGLGAFSSTELEKKLTGINVRVLPYIDELRQGLQGNASPKDFETLLQLIYLHFEPARRDQQAFEAFKSQLENQFKFMRSNPQALFSDTLFKVMTSGSPRTIILPTEAHFAQLQPDVMYDIYDRLFADASNFTFVFVGNIDALKHEELIVKYLGNLPKAKPINWIDRNIKFPDGKTEAAVYAGTEYKSMVAVLFRESFNYNEQDVLNMNLLGKAFNIKLRENMREEIGGVYGVGARVSLIQYPKPACAVTVNWGTNPGLVDTLSAIVFDQMHRLIKDGPTDEDLEKVKETTIRERETDDRQNRFWLGYIESALQNNQSMQTFESFKNKVHAVTKDDIKESAQKFLNPEHYARVVLYPEKKE